MEIQKEEEKLGLLALNEPFFPYDPSIKTFMIDNNKDPLYCVALVYDMPHRIKFGERQEHKSSNLLWRMLHCGHPSKLVI